MSIFYKDNTDPRLTTVGDPIECTAIGNVFAKSRSPENPLLIGSIKTNLGHTEGASGLAGIIKAVLCLEKACIPPTIGVKQLNPNSKHASRVRYNLRKI